MVGIFHDGHSKSFVLYREKEGVGVRVSPRLTPWSVHSGHINKLFVQCGCVLGDGAVHGAQPALSFGFKIVDDFVDLVCPGAVGEDVESEVGSIQKPSGLQKQISVGFYPVSATYVSHDLTALLAARSRNNTGSTRLIWS